MVGEGLAVAAEPGPVDMPHLARQAARQALAHLGSIPNLAFVFVAAPNAFTFFLGQRQPGLGKTTLYEYDFEGANGGGYRPSLTLPI